MIVIWGRRPYGTVDRCGPAHVATTFAHAQFLPLVPIRSVLVTGQGTLPLRLHGRSVAAAYLRTWGLLGMIGMVFGVLDRFPPGPFGLSGAGARGVAQVALLFAAAALFAMLAFGLGRLSREERAQLRVYGEFTSVPVDVALLRDEDGALRDHLHGQVVERARAFAASGYRTADDPESEWVTIALRQEVRDARLVRAALTLLRLQGGRARGEARRRLREDHAALWRKLKDLDPAVCSEPAAAAG